MIDPQLSGKSALITGTNNPHGTGAAIAKALAAQGVRVFLQYFQPPGAELSETVPDEFGIEYYEAMQGHTAQHVVDAILSQGGKAHCSPADLGNADAATALFDEAESVFGPVHILINNHAHSVPDSLLPDKSPEAGDRGAGGLGMLQSTFTSESFDRHFSVNTRATALLMTEFARRHIARGDHWGRIINVSTDGASGFAGEVSYGASKYAIESLSRAAAKEFGPCGITVNVASYGPIQTGWMSPELVEVVSRNTPLGRPGTPEDVADAIMLLVSEQARWLTGQVIHVGGGHKMG